MTTELPECLATALSEHGEQLLEELRLLDAMPQVRLTERSTTRCYTGQTR